MARINEHYLKLEAGYLFPEIGRRVKAFSFANPRAKIIRLGIGDVVLPLPPVVVAAIQKATLEMGDIKSFRGYGPEQGYDFLIRAIIDNDYKPHGIDLAPTEIFVSDGSKGDTGNIQELFSGSCVVAVTDPVYPVYVDTNIMAGRRILYMPATPKNNFSPELPKKKVDLIYLCSPNNPTGTVLDLPTLKKWVAYARRYGAIILFDAAYEAFIQDPKLPHSIYEIDGAKECAIEFKSFSKTSGFTGTRCAFTVVPHALKGKTKKGKEVSLNSLWNRRQTTKFNGVSYPIQRGAEACYSSAGKKQIRKLINYYMQNAKIIREGLTKSGLEVFGGIHAPYIWLKTPKGISSWAFFDQLLRKAHVVGTPGSGFGPSGEGHFRLSAFGHRAQVEEAVNRIRKIVPLHHTDWRTALRIHPKLKTSERKALAELKKMKGYFSGKGLDGKDLRDKQDRVL